MIARIRPIVIGLAVHGERLLVAEGYDEVKGERFFRPPGGEIEFGESSERALHREWQEELDVELASARFLAVLENRFTFNGEAGHEIAFVFAVELSEADRLREAPLFVREGELTVPATWLSLAEVRSGDARLYPDGLLDLIDAAGVATDLR